MLYKGPAAAVTAPAALTGLTVARRVGWLYGILVRNRKAGQPVLREGAWW